MQHPNVLQHQYSISGGSYQKRDLSTKGIWICTGFYGWDDLNKVSFLCHFDHPGSAASIIRILKKIRLQVPDNHHFKVHLIGGKRWFWSNCTRNSIKESLSQQNDFKFTLTETPFKNFIFDSINLNICSDTGDVTYPKLKGKSCLKGFSWFCKPMKQV